MNDVVFISDLHLHPDIPFLTARFERWVLWALENTRAVYILGDFFHAWAGDDTLDDWSLGIAAMLRQFHEHHIPVYLMVGNRDFLLGQHFADVAKVRMMNEPMAIELGHYHVLLVHGDRYCTRDTAHQWFRKLTRHPLFSRCFLTLPRALRVNIVCRVRMQSQRRHLPDEKMAVVPEALGLDATRYAVDVIVHGHTHQPMRVQHQNDGRPFEQIVLSDWEEKVFVLCYNETEMFHYVEYC